MQYDEIGSVSKFEDCSLFSDSLSSKIMDSDSLKLLLDLNNNSNWNFSVNKKSFGGGGLCECRIIINENQIE